MRVEVVMIHRKLMFAAAALAAFILKAPFAQALHPPKPVLSLREDLSIGGLDDEALFQWSGLAVDRTGNIYVLDMMDCSLKKFDSSGKAVARTGRKGQGPGEFLTPRLLDCSDRFVFAADQGVMGIMVFDHDLNYLRLIKTPSLVSRIKALSDERIAVHCLTPAGESSILILDGEGKTIDRLVYMDRSAGWLQDSVSFTADGRGGFLIAFLFQDRVERWANAATRIWSRSYFGGRPVMTEKISGISLPSETCFKDVAVDSRGLIYVLGGNRAKRSGRDILVLQGDGLLVQTLTLPEPTHCAYIDRKDRLYVRADEGVTIKRYEIRYE
jgi:hypothetical protein